MGLEDYKVRRDKFELDSAERYFCFPCFCCKWKWKNNDTDEPCRTCDYNAGAVDDDR